MDEDRIERFRRLSRVQEMPVLAEGEVAQDLIEVDDDELLDTVSTTQTPPEAASTAVSSRLYGAGQELARYATSVAVWPTAGFDQRYLHSC